MGWENIAHCLDTFHSLRIPWYKYPQPPSLPPNLSSPKRVELNRQRWPVNGRLSLLLLLLPRHQQWAQRKNCKQNCHFLVTRNHSKQVPMQPPYSLPLFLRSHLSSAPKIRLEICKFWSVDGQLITCRRFVAALLNASMASDLSIITKSDDS